MLTFNIFTYKIVDICYVLLSFLTASLPIFNFYQNDFCTKCKNKSEISQFFSERFFNQWWRILLAYTFYGDWSVSGICRSIPMLFMIWFRIWVSTSVRELFVVRHSVKNATFAVNSFASHSAIMTSINIRLILITFDYYTGK